MCAGDPVTWHVTGRVLVDDEHEVPDLWVRDGRVTFQRPSVSVPEMGELSGWVLPGLVDVHCHLGLGPQGATDRATTLAQAQADRDSGVLLIRDAGSPRDTSWLGAHRELPRVVRAGQHIARPGRYLRDFGLELDDPALLPDAVREQARRGDGWVKLIGDWIDRSRGSRGDLRPLWPLDVLRAAVAVAHEESARVTVHAFSHEVIGDLLAAGVDGIEHGTGITAETCAAVRQQGIAVTPTMLQRGRFAAIAERGQRAYPLFAAQMRDLHAQRYTQVRDLYDAGIPLLVGTDAGGTIEHGRIADECVQLVRAGLPAAEVVAAATWRARRFLGFPALVEGASADFVVYPADPRTDIDVLRHPSAVVLRGRVIARHHR